MLTCARITMPGRHQRRFSFICRRFSIKPNHSPSKPKAFDHLDEESVDFLPWLERKAGVGISSKLYIGKSAHGRSLFASKRIREGECILTVPYNVQITSDKLLRKVEIMLGNAVREDIKLAIVILVEQKMGPKSGWPPYLSRLPGPGEMHSPMFWSEIELDMIRQSSLYHETVKQKAQLEEDFETVKPALEYFSKLLESITFNEFKHAYALVRSRAWDCGKRMSLIPFADFMNHDGLSEAVVSIDDNKQVFEITAGRDYSPNEEVLIRYGNFSNAVLLLDFGFTLPYNIHNQVEIQVNISHHDFLREMKLEILQAHRRPNIEDASGFKYSNSFIIKEVKSATGKGKGLPQSLRAFARVLCCTSPQDLSDLVMEATENDGRLARRPFKDISRENRAHEILLSRLTQIIEEYNTSLESLRRPDLPSTCERSALRRQSAVNLLEGELRILKSASAWLKNYIANLSLQNHP